MIADTFDDCMATRIPDRKAFGRSTANEDLAACRTIEANVADDNVVLSFEGGAVIWIQNDTSTRKPFADVIVGISFEFESNAVR
jgi:hypothetical protein